MRLLALAAIITLLPNGIKAQANTPLKRLNGLASFVVGEPGFTADVPSNISAATLKAMVELELRRSGIELKDTPADSLPVNRGVVSIEVSVLPMMSASGPTGAFVYDLRLLVRRWVQTPSPDSTWFMPVAWESSYFGASSSSTRLQETLRNALAERATLLANAILASRGRLP